MISVLTFKQIFLSRYMQRETVLDEDERKHDPLIQVTPVKSLLADYDGYSISSKGFLPTLVDIMVI